MKTSSGGLRAINPPTWARLVHEVERPTPGHIFARRTTPNCSFSHTGKKRLCQAAIVGRRNKTHGVALWFHGSLKLLVWRPLPVPCLAVWCEQIALGGISISVMVEMPSIFRSDEAFPSA
jgi:hypothetical protein